MANIIQGKSRLEESTEINKTLLLIFCATFIGLMYVYISKSYVDVKTYLLVIGAFAVPGIYFSKKYFTNRKKVKLSYKLCEEIGKEAGEYYVVTNIFVMGVDRKGIEIEYIIVGKNGVFIVNTNEVFDKAYITLQINSLQNFFIRHNITIEKFISIKYQQDMWKNIKKYNGIEELSQEQIDKIIMVLKVLQK